MTIAFTILLGVIGSLIAAALFPFLTDKIAMLLAAWPFFASLTFRADNDFSGNWHCKWFVQSNRYDSEMIDPAVKIRQISNRVFIIFYTNNSSYYANGKIDSGKFITGVWYERTSSGYHGAFQLIVDPETKNLSGQWIGFSTEGIVKNGNLLLDKY